MKISVALATFDGGAYLHEQLDSLASQQCLPDELIVSDDASTDDTREIIRGFAGTAPFKVILLESSHRQGYAENFSRALSRCSGDLVFLCDQDDVWFSEKISTMTAFAAADEKTLCFMNDALLTDARLNSQGISKWQQIRAAGLPDEAFVMGCCVAVKRPLLELALPLPPAAGAHDNWLVGLADRLSLTRRHEQVLQYYRRHGGNASGFFVNQSSALSVGNRVRRKLKSLPRRLFSGEALDREWAWEHAVWERLQQERGQLSIMLEENDIQAVVRASQAYLQVLESRRMLRRLPVWQRPSRVAACWRDGVYEASGGRTGVIKDLFLARRRTRE
ncbi:glycosyltransferase [Thiolapillus sp.]